MEVQYIVQGEEFKKGQEVLDCFYLVRFWRLSGRPTWRANALVGSFLVRRRLFLPGRRRSSW